MPDKKTRLPKKLLSIALCAILMLTLLPTTALAGPLGWGGQTFQVGEIVMSIGAYYSTAKGTISVSSSLPSGVRLIKVGSNAWIFEGTPAPGTVGSHRVTLIDSADSQTWNVTINVEKGLQTIVANNATIPMGANYTLPVHSINGNGDTISGTDTPTYTFLSGTPGVATVNATTGVITPVSPGTTDITINSAENASYTAATQKTVTFTVNKADTTLTVDNVLGTVGQTASLRATLTDENGNPLMGKTVVFYVDGMFAGTSTITDANGVATLFYMLHQAGNYPIRATFNSDTNYNASSGSGTLTVNKYTPTVSLQGGDISGMVGNVGQKTITVNVADSYSEMVTYNCRIGGIPADNSRFYVGDGTFYFEFAASQLNSLAEGRYPIRVSTLETDYNNATSTEVGYLTVEGPPTITGPTTMTLTEGYAATSTGAYTLTGFPDATVTLDNNYGGKIIWNNTDKKLDIAAGLTKGTYPIRLTVSNNFGNSALDFTLTVTDTPTVNGITVLPDTASVYKGGAQQFTADVDVTGGAAQTVTWSVSGGTDSIIDSTGTLSVGMNETAATLTVTATSPVDSTKKDTATVTVTKYGTPYPVRRGFSVFTGSGDCSATIDADYSKFLRLLVDGVELDASNYTVTEGSTIITLKESYLKTLANGDYRVMAIFTDGQAETNLVINVPVDATGVTLDKTTANVVVGKTVQLTATISPDDATDKGVTWKSSDTSVATVDESGLVKGVKAGKATITVTTDDGGYTATCDVTVTSSSTAPQTGDSNDIMLWILLGVSSLLAGSGLYVWRKRKQNA